MLYITGRHETSSTVLQGSLNLVDLAGRCGAALWGDGLAVGVGGNAVQLDRCSLVKVSCR